MSIPDLAVHEAIARRGPPALAWEVLRRDPAYRAAFAQLPALSLSSMAADPDFTARWGMHFR